MKPLKLGYELAWRTESDEKFSKSAEWKKRIRPRILQRDNYTCQYCGYRSEKGMQVNHVDGNPKNNEGSNLETVCPDCHKIMHSGFWAKVHKVIEVYEKSRFSQNAIVGLTRDLRQQGKSDEEIRQHLGLEGQVPWREDLSFLGKHFGFISSSGSMMFSFKPLLSEEEQQQRLTDRDRW